jgi:hypothetical protein
LVNKQLTDDEDLANLCKCIARVHNAPD